MGLGGGVGETAEGDCTPPLHDVRGARGGGVGCTGVVTVRVATIIGGGGKCSSSESSSSGVPREGEELVRSPREPARS